MTDQQQPNSFTASQLKFDPMDATACQALPLFFAIKSAITGWRSRCVHLLVGNSQRVVIKPSHDAHTD